MFIPRTLEAAIHAWFDSPIRILIVLGPRQAGKTTLIRKALSSYRGSVASLNADEYSVRKALSQGELSRLSDLVQGKDLLFIDEAQRVPDVGINLKILHDGKPELRIIATGSSAFELAQSTGEALTGRAMRMTLLPLGIAEWGSLLTPYEISRRRDDFLIYGMYPGLAGITNPAEKADALSDVAESYLFKDIFASGGVRGERRTRDLARLLAFQAGSEVSYTELGTSLGMSKDTVIRHVDLLEKAFIVFRLQGYSRNLRSEVTRKDKIYFWDTGIRNAVIENFRSPDYRDDMGRLWENYLIAERRKLHLHSRARVISRFWRTHSGAEIDLVEDRGGALSAWEIKSGTKTARRPSAWAAAYPDASFSVVNDENWQEFLR